MLINVVQLYIPNPMKFKSIYKSGVVNWFIRMRQGKDIYVPEMQQNLELDNLQVLTDDTGHPLLHG